MVKFGKQFRAEQNLEWAKDYIDYKSLKHFISQLRESISKEEDKEKSLEFNPYEEVKIRSPSDSVNSRRISNAEQPGNNLEESLKRFMRMLDAEIKKVYFFFVNRERELYVSINSHLHIRQNYETFNLTSIEREFDELYKISMVTYSVSQYINLNMMAIKKILKKFDKNFVYFYGDIRLKYIQRKIEMKNSDLLYILQFKIIDEASALLEDLMCDLRSKFEEKKKLFGAENSNENRKEPLLPNSDFNMSSTDVIASINRYMIELQAYIQMIDDNNQNFRNNFKDWNSYLKQTTKVYNNAFSVTNNTSLCGISVRDRNNIGYEQIGITGKKVRKMSLDSEMIFSTENNENVKIILLHTFLFMFSFGIVIPSNIFYVKSLDHKAMLSGLMMACTPFGTLLSMFYTNRWIKVTYKRPVVVSTVMMVLGHLLYILASPCESIIPMIFGRLLLGFGSNRVANRSYLLKFIPKIKLSKYLLFFHLCSITGLASGPLISIVLVYIDNFGFDKNEYFNEFTNPAWTCLVICLIFSILVMYHYTEPLQSNFSIYSEPDGTTERSGSIVSKEVMSKNEKVMIEEINDKLSEINDRNQFSDTNLVARSIEQIAWREKKTTSYLYKCFTVFVLILLICRLTTESLLIISVYYIHDLDDGFDVRGIALLMSCALFMTIPVGFLFNSYFSAKIKDRRMLIYLIIACISFNILILNIFYASVIQYCIVFAFLIIFANILENVATTMFSKIIPSDYELWSMNAGYIIQITTTIGRILGSLMLTIAGFASDEDLNRITYGITLFFFICSLVLAIVFYGHLRVKAIARILRNRSIRKLKNSEF